MNTQLLEVHPSELKFIFEVKKQSLCSVHLTNLTNQYVAFKINQVFMQCQVKTTSPKKYCVRPNLGIIKPKTTCDFTVTMQAQKSGSLDCKDKFLIQSTVVPYGTNEEEIASSMFAKESEKYVDETKLRVVLTSPPDSPAAPPPDVPPLEPSFVNLKPKERSPVLSPVNGAAKQEQPSFETLKPKDKLKNGVENFPPDILVNEVEEHKNDNMEDSKPVNAVDSMKLVHADTEVHEIKQINARESKPDLINDAEELRSMIAAMESKLVEAEHMIVKMKEDKCNTSDENTRLKQELETLSRWGVARKVQVGFPPLFVCMVALLCLSIGFLFRS